MKKEKLFDITVAGAVGFAAFMEFGWAFFSMTTRKKEKKESGQASVKKQWFSFPKMKENHPRNGFEQEYEAGKQWCREQEMMDWDMESEDGLKLHALYFPAENAVRNVILCHGYRGSSFGDFAISARFLHENGCNLLMIDERCCGLSEGEYITFGAMEKRDIRDWTWLLSKRDTKKLPIYLYGMSMGAASVLMASGYELPQQVHGLIADCGFRSMRGELGDLAKNWFNLKRIPLLLWRCEIFSRQFGKFSMKDADTTRALERNRRPVLFIHGQEDSFVYPENTMHNYTICKAPKELFIVPGARHLSSIYVAPEKYKKKLLDMFRRYD